MVVFEAGLKNHLVGLLPGLHLDLSKDLEAVIYHGYLGFFREGTM